MKKVLIFVAAAPFALVLYALFTCALDESYTTTRYTVGYFMCVSADVRDVPVVEAVTGTLRYHSSCGDGPKPPSSSVMFRSMATDASLQAIDAHLRARDLAPDGDAAGKHTTRYGRSVDVYADPEGNVRVYWVE